MKNFINKILIFTFPILIGIVCLEWAVRAIPKDYILKNNYLSNHAANIEVLFLGNSHIVNGVNPKLMAFNAFNAASAAQTLEYDLALFHKYNNALINLKCLVVSFDYISVYKDFLNTYEKFRKRNYSIYYGINLDRSLEAKFEVTDVALKTNLDRVKHYFLNNVSEIQCDSLGWYKAPEWNKNSLLESSNYALSKHTAFFTDSPVIKKNIQAIDSLLSYTNKKKIKIIFVTAPACKYYREGLDKIQFNNTIKIVNDRVQKYPNAFYFNLIENPQFTDSDFYDADHLNERGSILFTHLLDSLIRL